MPVIRLFLYGIIILQLAACGHVVTGNLTTPQPAEKSTCAVGRNIVVLPFADYSYADDLETAFKRNMAVMEALTDQLVSKGFRLPIQEDTLKYLIDQNIIRTLPYSQVNKTESLERELSSNWSNDMKSELSKLIHLEQRASAPGENAPGTHGLDKKTLAKIGSDFSADYIMRGRIINYDVRRENKWQPWRRGLLPFFWDANNRLLLGIARPEMYDILDSTLWGVETTPGVIGNAYVDLRIWVQKTETGETVWTNRAEIKVIPKSVFAENNKGEMLDIAVKQAVQQLVNDFWSKTELYL